jgi:acylphosphatase
MADRALSGQDEELRMGATEPATCRLTAQIYGSVQGVGYRFFARRQAVVLGLRGYVRNLRNGAVEVVVEGPRPTLEAFVRILERGPSAADVERVETSWSDADGSFSGFHIRQ